MQLLLKRFSIFVGFAVLMAVVISTAVITRRQLGVQLENNAWLNHTRQVIFELEQTESLLKDAETGQRGYLFTRDARYLAPYYLARTQIDPHFESLTRLTADNPRQQVAVAELHNLAHEKLSELAQTIDLDRSGKSDKARDLVLSDKGLLIMNRIREVAAQARREEALLQSDRTAKYQKSVKVTIASIYIASSLAALGLILLANYIFKEMRLREKHAHELSAREEWFRVTLTSIGDAVVATNQEGKVTFLNAVAETLTGVSIANAMGRDVEEVFPIFNEHTGKPAENPVKKVLEGGKLVGLANHTVLKHADGHLTPIEDSAAPIRDDANHLVGVVLVFRDVTIERKTQELVRRSEKLAAAARLSATVAHEINNPLEAISNLVFLAKESPNAPADVVHLLDLAERELERVAHITRQTLGFYRESNAPELVEIAPMIDSVLGLFSNKIRAKKVTVQLDLEQFPPIMGVPGELRQAISNLISNALDAVSVKGCIRLKAQCIDDDGEAVVQLLIEDDGPGIPAENRDRIFEPFFTTKKDIGTGLGLWVTREIVQRHGGFINVSDQGENGDAQGARFVIQLPCDSDYFSGVSRDLKA
jgi:PAS domain S-box-containing protein